MAIGCRWKRRRLPFGKETAPYRRNQNMKGSNTSMDKIVRINMTDLSSKVETVPAAWAGLDGRGLTSTIVAAEVPPTCHPLGPFNKLIFAPGLLTGTPAANSGRL